ncbi:MAG: sugar ABC transporter permease [Chloroflexi bacterium HGW-Chloroflexi-8]|nr:MAG: sugar ABC transporter permease [Chloroflexi bacterium HGW-Chloroflexi-8]
MSGWLGRRKWITILLFLAPTILAILVFNVYPILLNTYISFTNRNKFRPNPDCDVVLTGLLDPICWPAFRDNAPTGLGKPYVLQDPILGNYDTLMGKLFTPEALLSLVLIGVTFAPLIGANYLSKKQERKIDKKIPTNLVWGLGILIAVALFFILNVPKSISSLMATGDFITVVFRTALFVLIRVPFTFILGLILALILNSENLPGKTFFRVALFVPWGASSVAILMALVWQFLFRQQGTINQIFAVIGGTGPIWLNDPILAFGVVVIADIWFSYPFFMVSILGALQSIPKELYEAAEVDGAGFWTKLMKITLPLIRPAVLPAAVLTSITAFQMFGTAFAITGGGPTRGAGVPGATEFVMVYAYKQIFQQQNYGTATAFAVMIFIMLFLATLYSLRVTKMTKGAYE